MKIILSRKGFDSSAGECASPIVDGQLVSLPIPDRDSLVTYGDVSCGSVASLGPIVESLTRGRVRASSGAHLDPDLDAGATTRGHGWRPLFGQVDAAQTHLVNQGVSKGDLFLMYGWFRDVEQREGSLRYVPGAPNRHVLYGWLQIGEVLEIGSKPDKMDYPAWSRYHPHFYGARGANNVLYVGASSLVLDGIDLGVPGAGRWPKLRKELQLTDVAGSRRGSWRLPPWFDPARSESPLSYHGDRRRWERLEDGFRLSCVGRGQEFVFDTQVYPEAINWVRQSLFGH